MATAQDLIARTLRLIGAIEGGEDPSAAEAADGLDALNEMLHGWRKRGVDLNHLTLALGDTLKVDDSFLRGIRFNLAVEIAPEYGSPAAPWIQAIAHDTFAAFQAHTFEFNDDLKVDRALHPRYTTRRSGAYDIDDG